MIVLQTGTCALFFAAQGGFLDIVRVLLDSGASLDLASYVSLQWIAEWNFSSLILMFKNCLSFRPWFSDTKIIDKYHIDFSYSKMSWKFKRDFLISFCLASCCLSIRKLFIIDFFPRTTWDETFLGEGLSTCSNEVNTERGNNSIF